MSLTLRCCGGVAGSETEAEEVVPTTNGGICRVSGDIIIANEGESVCVALWPDGGGPGAAGEDTDAGADEEDDEEDEDEVGSAASGGAWVGVISIGSAAAVATGVRHLYDGLPLPYGDVRSAPVAAPTSPSGYLRFRDADGGVSGATAGNRISSLITATGRTEGAGTADEEDTDRRRTEDDDDAGMVLAAADTGGGKAVDEDGGTGRVHLISQGGGGGM